MWRGDTDPLDYKMPYGERSIASNVRIELPLPFTGEEKESFPCWARQFEVAVQALVTGAGGVYEYELVRILPTRLAKAAFLLWDSLPKAVQSDYSAVKEKLQDAFGQRHFLDRFRANLSARPRALGESLEVFAADISKLVQEAFPGYGDVAQREEKFRRFLHGLDPSLRAKCHEQGATDLEEALIIAGRCEMARDTLKMDYGNPQPDQPAVNSGSTSMVHSISDGGGFFKAIDQLNLEMREMRMDMRQMADENKRLRSIESRSEWKKSPSAYGGQCQCDCGYYGCQSRRPQTERGGRSPDRGWHEREAEGGSRERQFYRGPEHNRAPSPNWRGPRPARGPFYDEPQRQRGVRFLSPKREDSAKQSGKEM